MAYVIPTFNLVCNVYTSGDDFTTPRLSVECNLALGRRVTFPPLIETEDLPVLGMYLLVPAGTDIRDGYNATGNDNVECPAGSGRFYTVFIVDDIGKGFPNEHRFAYLVKFGGSLWPTPIP